MRYSITKLNESSLYQLDVPKELEIHTSNGTFAYRLTNIYRDGLQLRAVYTKDEKKIILKIYT